MKTRGFMLQWKRLVSIIATICMIGTSINLSAITAYADEIDDSSAIETAAEENNDAAAVDETAIETEKESLAASEAEDAAQDESIAAEGERNTAGDVLLEPGEISHF